MTPSIVCFFAITPSIIILLIQFINVFENTLSSSSNLYYDSSPIVSPDAFLVLAYLVAIGISFVCFVFTLLDGDVEKNKYGLSPKYAEGTKKCNNCKGIVPPGNMYCIHCGYELIHTNALIEQCTCPHCNTSTDAHRDFCLKCGQPLSMQATKPE